MHSFGVAKYLYIQIHESVRFNLSLKVKKICMQITRRDYDHYNYFPLNNEVFSSLKNYLKLKSKTFYDRSFYGPVIVESKLMR